MNWPLLFAAWWGFSFTKCIIICAVLAAGALVLAWIDP